MTDGLDPLRDELADAPEAPPSGANTTAPPPPPGERQPGEIWPGCPVKPLGVFADNCYYLDRLGQLRTVNNHSLQAILSVFGGNAILLGRHFPTFDKNGKRQVGKFSQMDASAAMITACHERGLWSKTGSERGPGAWIDEEDRLILHVGDAVLLNGQWCSPGVYGGKVYAASDPRPRPAESDRQSGAALELLEDLETWRWSRPDLDPQLMLGLIIAQMIGGALEWRPVGWLTGDAATGKSTLQKLLLYLHGGEKGLLQAADATEAGIRAVVGASSLPVAIDELEPDPENPKKAKAIIELARRAASGAQIFRGSSDQQGHQSNAFSSFLFSSILVPDMPAQDRARLILLDLERLPDGAAKPSQDPRRLRAIGAALRRVVLDRWVDWPVRLDLWRAALARHGQTGRSADNYGTVLALYDLVSYDRLPDAETLDNWAAKIARAIGAAATEVGSNADDMLLRLMSQPLEVWSRGRKETVALWVAMAARLPGAPDAIDTADAGSANGHLAKFGLRVYGQGDAARLLIANKPIQGLCDLFAGSMWANGVWAQAARRIEGAESHSVTLAHVRTRATTIPLSSIPGMLHLPVDRARGTVRPASPPEQLDELS